MHIFKWDKRRAQKNKSHPNPSLDVFDFVLLSLIFVIGVVLFKFLMIYAIITMPCLDYVANFGAGRTGPPAFKAIFYISILLFAFWLTLVILDPKRRNSIPKITWQFILLLCIFLMGHSAFHMSIWNKPTPPDGTLGVADGVWATKDGKRKWSNIPLNPQLYEHVDGGMGLEQEYRAQRCVWLNEGVIAVENDPYVGDLDTFIKETEHRWATGELIPFPVYPIWPTTSFKVYLNSFFSLKSQFEILRNKTEFLRPLTTKERERFLAKQKCLKENAYDPSSGTHPQPYGALLEQCDPQSYPPWPTE